MSKAEELAQQYADASATWHVENLYGGSKSYTEECRKDKAAIGVDLFSELRRLAAENEQMRNDLLAAKDALNLLERYEYAAATIALRIALSPTDH